MATASLSSFTWKGYYSSTNWLSNQNCYCDPAYIYFNYPAAAGQTTGRTFTINVPVLYSKSITSSYEASLYIDGAYKAYTSGSISLNASTKTLTLTFSGISASTSGGSGYVWLDFGYGTVQLYSSSWKPYGTMAYTAVTSCGAPTSIWGSRDRVIPGQLYTFSWSGASSGVSNSISNYYVAYRYGSGSWTYDSTTSTSYSFTPSTNYRGSTLQFAVQTRGSAGESYYSSWAYSGYYTINSLPPAPSVSVSASYYSYDSGGNITFTATAGSDAEEDSLTIYYSTSSSFSSQSTYSGSFTKTFSSGTSSATYYFRTYDGYEYSSTTSKTVYRNTPPTISSLGLDYTSLLGKNSSSETYIRSISTAPSVSKTVTYSWRVYHNTSKEISEDSYAWLGSSANNTFDLSNYKGKYVCLRLVVNDGYDTRSSYSDWFLVPTDISRATSVSITNGSGTNVIAPINSVLYTGNTIYISWTLPEVSDTQLSRYSYVELQKQSGSSWSFVKTYPSTASTTSEESYTKSYSLPSDITNDSIYRIIVYTKETSPGTQNATYIYTSNTLRRAPKPELASQGLPLVVSPTTIRPTSGDTGELGSTTSGSSLIFTHSVENKSPDLGAKWTLTATVNGQVITLMDKKKVSDTVSGITSKTADSLITHTFGNDTWSSLFYNTWNNSYNANITLSLENDFGDSVAGLASTTLKVDYREPARWAKANSVFTKKIKYTSNLLGDPLTSVGSTSDNAVFLVNAGEVIQLTIPDITDSNNDTNKTVYIERGIASGWSNALSTIQSATNWTQIGNFKPSSGSVYEYTIPDISEDVFYVFRAWIKGTNTLESRNGNYVGDKYQYAYSPTVVRACRSRNPTIEIVSVSDTEPVSGVFTIKPSITLNASNEYSTYKNWERGDVATNGTPVKNITIEAQICNDGSFSTGNTTTYVSGNILSYDSDYSSVNAASFSTLSKPTFKNQTVFVRLKISVNTGYGVIKESFSPIYTYYATSPTVSHRSHQVGINTNKFNTDEILALAMPSSEKKMLRFTGEEGTNTVNLYLDLSNLTLSSKVGNNDELTSKIKFGTATNAKITDFNLSTCNLSTCTVTTSLIGSTAGVTLNNFTLDGGTW